MTMNSARDEEVEESDQTLEIEGYLPCSRHVELWLADSVH
jgi:hypothetical protein